MSTDGDRISLVVPAEPGYGRVARAAASSLALRLGVPYRDVEDLRLALDETVILFLHPPRLGTELAIDFRVGADQLTITIEANGEPPDGAIGPEWPAEEDLTRYEALVADTGTGVVVNRDGHRVELTAVR